VETLIAIHFFHSFVLIQAARPIKTTDKSNGIKAHTNIKNTERQTEGKLYNIVNIRQRTERADD